MKQRPRIYYSASQKAMMAKRWKEGWTLHEIGKLLIDRTRRSTGSLRRLVGFVRQSEAVRRSR